MNILLIFFAIPFAVIVISIALEKLLDCPILVSAIVFSILLLVAVMFSNTTYFILAIIYAILAFVVAWFLKYIGCVLEKIKNSCNNNCNSRTNNEDSNILTVNGRVRVIDSNNNGNNTNNNTGTFCGCYRRR